MDDDFDVDDLLEGALEDVKPDVAELDKKNSEEKKDEKVWSKT